MPKPLIYLVEDDLDDQYMFKMIVQQLSLDVELCIFDDGLSAYKAIAHTDNEGQLHSPKRLPDLVLLDLNLPIWDGKKTLSIIKKDQRLCSIPILIYTTSKAEYDIAECYQLGANSFITKAAEFEKLSAQIQHIFTYWLSTASLSLCQDSAYR